MEDLPSRIHFWLCIEEPNLLPVPGTDWEEVGRTRIAPSRLAPDRDVVGEKARAELIKEGWTEVEVVHQGWDDHPQVGSAWWILIKGVPPPDFGGGNARLFRP